MSWVQRLHDMVVNFDGQLIVDIFDAEVMSNLDGQVRISLIADIILIRD